MAVQDTELSAFLKTFLDPLHHRQPESSRRLWVFWSKDEEEEGSQNNSSSADVATHRMIYDKIKSAFSIDSFEVDYDDLFILQFWAPVTIDGRRLLSTSGQPFSVSHLDNDLAEYRLRSLEYPYNIDETNKRNIEQHPDMIVSGAASSAFLNRFPVRVDFEEQSIPKDHYALEAGLITSYLLPIFCPSQSSSCFVGVVEASMGIGLFRHNFILTEIMSALEKVGLRVLHEQERIPYKIINGFKSTRDEIEEALEIVCESHCITLAQVWITYKDEYHSFYLENTRKNRMFPKLTGYIVDQNSTAFQETFEDYYIYSGIRLHPHMMEELFKKTFQDYEPRFCKNIIPYWKPNDKTEGSALVICLRSISTGYLDYAFEFIWRPNSKYLILLEQLLLTLKRCLPSFKFASGAELGDELNVIDVDNSSSETRFFKIFQGKKISPIPETPEKGKKQIVEDYQAHSKSKCKTTPILLSRQAIEQQFGNTMKEAAKNLSVSLSTLKRKCHGYGISEWEGPTLAKRKVNDSSNNQRDKNEEDNGAIQDPSAVNKNENTLIIKAEWEDDMIKFQLSISQATFVTVEKEIGMQFNLTMGTYKLKYLDEDGDWILLKSDQDMSNCIKSSRKLDGTQVRLRVQQSTQPIPGPTGSYELCRS